MLRRLSWPVFVPAILVVLMSSAGLRAAAGSPSGDKPTLEAVVAQIVKAQGGEKLKSVKSSKATGKVVIGGGQAEGKLTIVLARPNKMRQEIDLGGAKLVQAYDGTTVWQINPFTGSSKPEKVSGEEADSLIESADLDGPFIDSEKKGYKLALGEDEEIDGTPVHVVKVTNKRGETDTYYVDAATGLILKTRGKEKMQGAEVEMETVFSNYKEVNGIMTAHAVDRLIDGRPFIQIVLERLEYDVAVDDAMFSMPE
ncbi:MAG: hypothetical protein NZ585_08030 [Chloracidobacterium sp.]|nr:hypothetical protein [Chloracidobacterium sp.]MDW8218041.1 hypothetical protein [Acidobacteriota bacterium]